MGSNLPLPAPQPRTAQAMLRNKSQSAIAVNFNGQLDLKASARKSEHPSIAAIKTRKSKQLNEERQQLKV